MCYPFFRPVLLLLGSTPFASFFSFLVSYSRGFALSSYLAHHYILLVPLLSSISILLLLTPFPSSTCAIIHHLAANPSTQATLQAELDEQLGTEDELVANAEQVKRLPYLDACINEGLRIHSTSALGLPRVVPEGECEFGFELFRGPGWVGVGMEMGVGRDNVDAEMSVVDIVPLPIQPSFRPCLSRPSHPLS
jgi:hypothetical protein